MKCKTCGCEVDKTMVCCPECGAELKPKKKEKKKAPVALIATIIIVFLIGCGGIWFFIQTASNSRNVMMTHFAKLADRASTFFESEGQMDQLLLNNKNLDMGGNLEISLDLGEEIGFNNIKASFHYADAQESKKAKFDAELLMSEESLFSIEGGLQDNTLYMKAKEEMRHYYSMAAEYASLFQAIDTKDYSEFGTIFVEVLKDTVKEKDIKTVKTTTLLNKKETKVTKHTYTVNATVMKSFVESFVTKVKGNDKALAVLVRTLGISKEEVIQQFEEGSQALLEEFGEEQFDFSIYVRGMNEVVMTEISDSLSKMQYYYHDQVEGFKIVGENEGEEAYLQWTKEKDTYKVEGSFMDQMTITGTVKPTDKGSELDFVLAVGTEKLKLKLTNTTTEVEKDSKYTTKSEGVVTVVTGGIAIDVNVKMDFTIAKGGDITLDVAGSKDIDQLTEEETLQLQKELMEIPLVQLFFQNTMTGEEF